MNIMMQLVSSIDYAYLVCAFCREHNGWRLALIIAVVAAIRRFDYHDLRFRRQAQENSVKPALFHGDDAGCALRIFY